MIKSVLEYGFYATLAILSIVALCTISAAHGMAGPRLNLTPSVPRGLYFYVPGVVKRGDFIQACLPDQLAAYARAQHWLDQGVCPNHTEPIVKVLAALPGDTVIVRIEGVHINGLLWPMSAIRSVDASGRPITMRLAFGKLIIAPEHIFLLGLHPHSWDSRYFGSLPSSSVTGRWFPLITEKGSLS